MRAKKAFCTIALIGAGLLCSPSHAEEAPPYLVARSDQMMNLRTANNLELQVAARDYGIPGAPSFLSSRTVWMPSSNVALRAGITQTSYSPCPAPLSGDCNWSFIRHQPAEETGFNVGASWQALDSLSVSVDYRNEPANLRGAVANQAESFGQFAASEDLSLSCKLDTQAWGDLELGLQLSRWQEAGTLSESVHDPYNSAALGLGWQWGSFRGDVKGRHMEMVGGGDKADAWNTLDVSFAWKTPWNASLSVGARNVLNQPAPATSTVDNPDDDFLGRVPYVRYQQDL